MVAFLKRRHFVPNPVVMHSTGSGAVRRKSLSIHTRYDASNRWVGETVAAGSTVDVRAFAYDGNQVVLQFDESGATAPAPAMTAANLTHRYLWGPAVDQLMADEQTSGATSGTVVWRLRTS